MALFDPFGNAVKTCLTYNLVGEDVLISGAGPIGLMAVMICKKVGARKIIITDVNDERLEKAKELGVDMAINASKGIEWKSVFNKLEMKEGIDVGLYMTGFQKPFEEMVQSMRPSGKIALLGIPSDKFNIDFSDFIFKMLTLKGVYGRNIFDTWRQSENLIKMGIDLDKIISHQLNWGE